MGACVRGAGGASLLPIATYTLCSCCCTSASNSAGICIIYTSVQAVACSTGGEKAHSQAVAAGGTEPDDEHPSSQWAIFFPSSPSMVLLGLEMHITYKNSHLVYLRSAIGDQRSSLFFVVAPPPTVAQKRRRRRQRRWRRKRGVPFSLEPIDGDGNEKIKLHIRGGASIDRKSVV